MKERPMLVRHELVPKIFDGTKTETRRPVESGRLRLRYIGDPGGEDIPTNYGCVVKDRWAALGGRAFPVPCKHGEAGDRLWVRESWSHDHESLDALRREFEDLLPADSSHGPYYRADGIHEDTGLKWIPSIFMPRWACRLVLPIASVRPERLQSISDEAIQAEGVDGETVEALLGRREERGQRIRVLPLRDLWRLGWDALNAHRGLGWATNPWVWVIGFDAQSILTADAARRAA